MLSPEHRLRRSADFSQVMRRGRRAGSGVLTAHLLLEPSVRAAGAPRAGLVVGKAVGGSVVRSRTARRLRHLLRERLPALPPGARLVIRAGPAAATTGTAALAGELDAVLARVLRSAGRP